MAILVFAGVLSVPSAVFAEASWYGSLRAGVQSSNSELSVFDAGARWGIRGSAEAGEGLTAVYRFETKISSNNAESSGGKATVAGTEYSAGPGGRLSYVGLSGGFGTVTVGQIWSASYNSFGAVTDNSWFWGDAETSYRHGNAVSYAFSNDLMSLQVDALYQTPDAVAPVVGEDDTTPIPTNVVANRTRNRDNLQQVEFGLSINIGDIGKVAIAHKDDKHSLNDTSDKMSGGVLVKTVPQLMAPNAAGTALVSITDDVTSWRTKSTFVAGEVSVANLTAYVGSKKSSYTNTTMAPATAVEAGNAGDGSLAVKPDEKTTFFGIRGGLGDTGLSYVFQWRDVKDSHKPWLLSLTKSLGDSASLVFEHANNDNDSSNKTGVALAINF